MAVHTFTEQTYVVIHSDDGYLQYNEMEPGTELVTPHTEMEPGTELVTPHTVEAFTDKDLAIARAEELGYVFTDPDALFLEPLE